MAVVKNFGLRWERKYVWFGHGGHLKGHAKNLPNADFRGQIGVYILYDKNENIVYVGQAKDIFERLKQHTDDHLWNRWEYFTWAGFRSVNGDGSLSQKQDLDSGVSGFTYETALNEIEAILIKVIEPKLNKKEGKLPDAAEYYQTIDPRVADISNADLKLLIERLSNES